MMPRILPASVLAATLSLAGVALAQEAPTGNRLPCTSYDELAHQLGDRYKEAPVSAGLQANGNVLQVFASAETGTWTILSTAPTGLSCVMAVGKSWEIMDQPATGPQA